MGLCRWHITFGTYASRLHGGAKPTVDRRHNRLGEDEIVDDPVREAHERGSLSARPVLLSEEQRVFIESVMAELCVRGGWGLIECAAAPNHVHVVVDADERVHGKQVRAILKRWLTQALNGQWKRATRSDGMSWWAEGGSARAVRGVEYKEAVERYVREQRATKGGKKGL